LISLSRLQWLVHLHLHSWTLEMTVQTTRLQLKKRLLRNCYFFVRLHNSCKFFISMNTYFSLVQRTLSGTTLPILTLLLWEDVSRLHVVSTSGAGLATSHEVNQRYYCIQKSENRTQGLIQFKVFLSKLLSFKTY
jgi:hypothetical protein